MNEHPTDVPTSLDSSRAGFLEQLSNEEFWNYARAQARVVPYANFPEEYLECRLGGKQCLISLTSLFEVVRPPLQVAFLPATPAWMPGIVAWRGQAIAVIDLEAFLFENKIHLQKYASEGELLIIQSDSITIGLYVPAIGATVKVQSEKQEPLTNSSPWYILPTFRVAKAQFGEALILDIPLLLQEVLPQIEKMASYG